MWSEIAGIAYLLWIIFIFAYVSSLKEIRKRSWHYWLYSTVFDTTIISDTCRYRAGLALVFPLVLIAGFIVIVAMVVGTLRFLWFWLVSPILLGRVPRRGLRYYVKNEWLEDCGTEQFLHVTPLFIYILVGLIYWGCRVTFLATVPLEKYVFSGLILTSIVCLLVIWLFTRPSLRTMWKLMLDKICVQLPVID